MAESTDIPSADPKARFSDRVADYARCRPGYPLAARGAILDGLGPYPDLEVADVGAGTGISSHFLAGAADQPGPVVHAIEPNAAMRSSAQPHPRITWRDGSGETTGLPDSCVDVVVCAQAFHWMRAEEAMREFARVLRRRAPSGARGRVALVWNVHDDADAFVREYRRVMLAHAKDPPKSPWATQEHVAIASSVLFTNYRLVRFPYEQRFDETGLIGRATSSSYVPREGEAFESMKRDLSAVFRKYQKEGRVTMPYRTEIHLAEVAS
ncbi:MAG TPA: class I SAM-dependent methyltransferase [Phycisphaerales bacterium]|nr:class I SAM-dependent methyltransferase [Phycisphaerales bacterium]